MQVGKIALPPSFPVWDLSDMAESDEMKGVALYGRLMALKPADLAETKWAEMAGLNRGLFTNLKGKGGSIRSDNLRKLLSVIGKTEADLSEFPEGNATPVHFEGAAADRMPQNMPVFGTALGAEMIVEGEAIEQTMLNSGDIIEYRKRPIVANGIERVYGLYVQGSSMYPAHRDGAFLYAQREVPLRIGDDVVVYLRPQNHEDDGERASHVLIKRLVRRSAQYVELEQFQPAKTFRIAMGNVLRIDRVLTADDYA